MTTMTYKEKNGYLYPDLPAPEMSAEPLTKYGLMRKEYLRTKKRGMYAEMLMSGTLWSHCLEIQRQAQEQIETLTTQMMRVEEVTELLKSQNQIEWIRRANSIWNRAEEIVLAEIIFS